MSFPFRRFRSAISQAVSAVWSQALVLEFPLKSFTTLQSSGATESTLAGQTWPFSSALTKSISLPSACITHEGFGRCEKVAKRTITGLDGRGVCAESQPIKCQVLWSCFNDAPNGCARKSKLATISNKVTPLNCSRHTNILSMVLLDKSYRNPDRGANKDLFVSMSPTWIRLEQSLWDKITGSLISTDSLNNPTYTTTPQQPSDVNLWSRDSLASCDKTLWLFESPIKHQIHVKTLRWYHEPAVIQVVQVVQVVHPHPSDHVQMFPLLRPTLWHH